MSKPVYLTLMLLLAAFLAGADAATMRVQTVMIPKSSGPFSIDLETQIYAPPGLGPFPLIVLSHGKAHGDPRFQESGQFYGPALEFVRRGYVVIAPNRMGYSKSGGRYIEGCEMTSMGQTWADDVVPAIDYARKLSYVDASRIVLVGQSQGGFVSVALGSRNLPGVLGIIDFAGGMRNDNCVGWEQSVINAFGAYGKTSRVPALFFYGDNDSYFAQPLPHQFLQAYNDAGGHATMIEVGTWHENSHLLFHKSEGKSVWLPPVEKFLAGLGLPSQRTADLPASGETADVSDVGALSQIVHGKQSILEGYDRFLWHSPPRAFAISPDGHFGFAPGDNAEHDAVSLCATHTKLTCSIYAVDDRVVFSKSGP